MVLLIVSFVAILCTITQITKISKFQYKYISIGHHHQRSMRSHLRHQLQGARLHYTRFVVCCAIIEYARDASLVAAEQQAVSKCPYGGEGTDKVRDAAAPQHQVVQMARELAGLRYSFRRRAPKLLNVFIATIILQGLEQRREVLLLGVPVL